MGGRGASGGEGNLFHRTLAQDRTIKRLVKQTQNLKKEQYRIINADGEVVLVKKGERGAVTSTVGEKREYLKDAISLHNHPEGGPFSEDDLNEFGYGAKEIVVAAPEGTYRLINKNVGKQNQYEGWYDMREKMRESIPEANPTDLLRAARESVAAKRVQKKMDTMTQRWDNIRAREGVAAANAWFNTVRSEYDALGAEKKQIVEQERRRLEVKPFADFYKQNAAKYGFVYRFEKKK